MKHILFILLFFFSVTTQINSQNLTKKEKIKTLFVVMHQDSLMIKSIDIMTNSMITNITKYFNDSSFKKNSIEVSEITSKLMQKSLKRGKENALKMLDTDLVDIYDRLFTTEEIDDLTKFYTSKTGQKMLNVTPVLTQEIMNIMSSKYQADTQKLLMKDIEEIVKEMEL